MRSLTIPIAIFVAALATPVPGAEPPLKAGGEVLPPAAKAPPQKKKSPHASGLRFSVPYAFANVHKDLKNAIIRCDVLAEGAPLVGGSTGGNLGPGLPTSGGMATSIGFGSVVIALNGQPGSGTATVIPKPSPGASFDDAIGFLCSLQLNNGFETVSPGTGANVPMWAKNQAGSQLGVTGAIQ